MTEAESEIPLLQRPAATTASHLSLTSKPMIQLKTAFCDVTEGTNVNTSSQVHLSVSS